MKSEAQKMRDYGYCPDVAGRDCGGGQYPLPDVRGPSEPGERDVQPMRKSLSDRALELVDGPRQDAYAPPARNMRNIGRVWAAMLDLPEPIPPEQVALMLAGMKLVRASYKAGEDSLVDLVGYAEIAERLR